MPHETRGFIFNSRIIRRYSRYIEVADGHHVTAKKSQVRIKMCDDNRNPFIATLHNVILAPDLCDNLFSIIALMNLGYTCLFHKGFSTVNFGAKKNGAVTLPHSAQKNIHLQEKSRRCQRKINYQQERKLLYNYCIKGYGTDPTDHCQLGILIIFGKMQS